MSRPVQDYIVRQRFSNALPPPPGAPKLLEIPTGGLKPYCTPAYASRLARAHPLNIEADAELGMPIDLVGMPGVFEGNESSILAPLRPPPIHPADRNLLRPLKSLGQNKKDTGISFLRRTQYTADGGIRAQIAAPSLATSAPKRRRLDTFKEDPIAILRNTIKGFDLANPNDAYTGPDTAEHVRGAQPTSAEVDAWRNPKHPTNPSLKPIDFYPVLPDIDAFPDDKGYMVARFHGDPTDVASLSKAQIDGSSQSSEKGDMRTDPRMEAAILHALDLAPDIETEYRAKLEAHHADPMNTRYPGVIPIDYEFFIPEDLRVAQTMLRAFEADGGMSVEEARQLYTTTGEDGAKFFKFPRTRVYETRQGNDHTDHPYEWVAMALHDGEEDGNDGDDDLGLGYDDDGIESKPNKRKLQKGAYYVPVATTQQLRPRRVIVDKLTRDAERAMDECDMLRVMVKETDVEEVARRKALSKELDPEGTTA